MVKLRYCISKVVLVALVFSLSAGTAFAQKGEIIAIPGFGDVGITAKGGTYTVGLGSWGTWDFKGTYKSAKDFDLQTGVPVGKVTDFIPGVGQILAMLGFSTVDFRLKPSGLGMGVTMEGGGLGALRGSITDALGEIPGASMVMDAIISGLEVKKLSINGSVFGKTLKGVVEGEISVIGKTFKFKEDGDINLKKMISNIVNNITPAVTGYISDAAARVYKESRDAVLKYGSKGLKNIDRAWDDAMKIAKETVKTIDYATNSYETNLKKDLPKFIKGKSDPLLRTTNAIMNELYWDLLPIVRNLPSPKDKEALIKEAFDPVEAELDKRWSRLRSDDAVKAWSTMDSREKELMKRYKDGISVKWDEHKAFRSDLFTQLLESKPLYRIKRSPQEALKLLEAYATSKTPVIVEVKTDTKAWDVLGGPGKKAPNGSTLAFYTTYGGNQQFNQHWIFVPAGKPNEYHIMNVDSGRYIHISGGADKDAKGNPLTIWDGAGLIQTKFTAKADAEGYIHFISAKGFAFDLQGGEPKNRAQLQLWTDSGDAGQAFYISAVPF